MQIEVIWRSRFRAPEPIFRSFETLSLDAVSESIMNTVRNSLIEHQEDLAILDSMELEAEVVYPGVEVPTEEGGETDEEELSEGESSSGEELEEEQSVIFEGAEVIQPYVPPHRRSPSPETRSTISSQSEDSDFDLQVPGRFTSFYSRSQEVEGRAGYVRLGSRNGPVCTRVPHGQRRALYKQEKSTNSGHGWEIEEITVAGETIYKPERTCMSAVLGFYQNEDNANFISRKTRGIFHWSYMIDDTGKVCLWHVSKTSFQGSRAMTCKEFKDEIWEYDRYIHVVWGGPAEKTCLYKVLKALEINEKESTLFPSMSREEDADWEQVFSNVYGRTIYFTRTGGKGGVGHVTLDCSNPRARPIRMNPIGFKKMFSLCDRVESKLEDTGVWRALRGRNLITCAVEGEHETFFGSVEYALPVEQSLGGFWIKDIIPEDKKYKIMSTGEKVKNPLAKLHAVPTWVCNSRPIKTSVEYTASCRVNGALVPSRTGATVVETRELKPEEYHAVGILRTVRADKTVVYSLPCLPTGQLREWAIYKITKEKALVETPVAVCRTSDDVIKMSELREALAYQAEAISKQENKFVRTTDKVIVDKLIEEINSAVRSPEGISADLLSRWERTRHELCSEVLAAALKVDFEQTDVNLERTFGYTGEGFRKTPDFVCEVGGEIHIIDVKTTSSDPVNVAESLLEKYGPLRAGLEEFMQRKVNLSCVVFVFSRSEHYVLSTPEMRPHLDLETLRRRTAGVQRGQKSVMSANNYTSVSKGRFTQLEGEKATLFETFINAVMRRMPLVSPDPFTDQDGKTLGKEPEMVVKKRELLKDISFGPMDSQKGDADAAPMTPAQYEEIANWIIAKAREERAPKVEEVIEAAEKKLSSRGASYNPNAPKFNALPLLQVKDSSPGVVASTNTFATMADGTFLVEPGSKFDEDGMTDDKHKKPEDVGFCEEYTEEFDKFVSHISQPGVAEEVARATTELYENIAYMEGRRMAARKELKATMSSNPGNYKDYSSKEKKKMRQSGVTVFKRFKGYTLAVRKGSALTQDKQIKVKIIAKDENVVRLPGLKDHATELDSKWYTVSLPSLGHLVRAEELLEGLKALSDDRESYCTMFSYFLFMRTSASEALQNNRYVWSSGNSYHGDKMGLIKTIVPDFWTSRICSVVAHKQVVWWAALLRGQTARIAEKASNETRTDREFNHVDFPSFVNPRRHVPASQSMCEIYISNLSARDNQAKSHRDNKITEKLLECEIKWRLYNGDRHAKIPPIEVLKSPAMFKYSSQAVREGARILKARPELRLSASQSICEFMLKKLDQLSTLKSSVKQRSEKATDNQRRKAAENFADLYKKTGFIGICVNIQELEDPEPFFNDIFPKSQIGPREITILHWKARLRIWLLERIAESYNKYIDEEMITDKKKEERQVNILSEFRNEKIRAARNGTYVVTEYHCLDATRWSPGFNVTHFGVLADELFSHMPAMADYAKNIMCLLLRKQIRMPESWVSLSEKMSDKSIQERLDAEPETMKEIRKEVRNNGGYMYQFSGMGQGILHQFSSLYHCAEVAFEDRINKLTLEKLGVTSFASSTMVSSDDKTKLFLYTPKNSEVAPVISRALWQVSSWVSVLFNIHQNHKKSFGGNIIAEFNSYFSVGKEPLHALIKDVYSACAIPNLTSPEQAVDSKLGDFRRLLEHGMTNDTMAPFYERCRATMIRRYTYRREDLDQLCALLDCPEKELPPQLGFMPGGEDRLLAMLFGKECLCFQGSDNLKGFYRAYFSNSHRDALETSMVGGKYNISLDMRFDERNAKLRERLIESLGAGETESRRMMDRSALSKMLGSDSTTGSQVQLLSYPYLIKNEDMATNGLPVHSLVRAAQAATKVKIRSMEGRSKGLVEAARAILKIWNVARMNNKILRSNVEYFKVGLKYSQAYAKLRDKFYSARWRRSHGRRKPRLYNLTPGSQGVSVSPQDFVENVLCSPDPKMNVARKILSLEQGLGTIVRGATLQTDPMRFFRENFGEKDTFVNAARFVDFFIARSNFGKIRIALTQAPGVQGEDNFAILLSETLRKDLILEINHDLSEESKIAESLILKKEILDVPPVIDGNCTRTTARACIWAAYAQGRTDVRFPVQYLENETHTLTLSWNAIFVYSKAGGSNSKGLFCNNTSEDIDPAFILLVKRDMANKEGNQVWRDDRMWQGPGGLTFYRASFKVEAITSGSLRKTEFIFRSGKQDFVAFTDEDGTAGVSFTVPKPSIKEEDLLDYLASIKLPVGKGKTKELARVAEDNKKETTMTMVQLLRNLRDVIDTEANDQDERFFRDEVEPTDPVDDAFQAEARDMTQAIEVGAIPDEESSEDRSEKSKGIYGYKVSLAALLTVLFRFPHEVKYTGPTKFYAISKRVLAARPESESLPETMRSLAQAYYAGVLDRAEGQIDESVCDLLLWHEDQSPQEAEEEARKKTLLEALSDLSRTEASVPTLVFTGRRAEISEKSDEESTGETDASDLEALPDDEGQIEHTFDQEAVEMLARLIGDPEVVPDPTRVEIESVDSRELDLGVDLTADDLALEARRAAAEPPSGPKPVPWVPPEESRKRKERKESVWRRVINMARSKKTRPDTENQVEARGKGRVAKFFGRALRMFKKK